MSELPEKKRHYPKVKGLEPRFEVDASLEMMINRDAVNQEKPSIKEEKMTELPTKERHYSKIEGLIPRSEGDVSQEFITNRILGLSFLNEFIDPLPKEPKLVSTASGTIEELLFTIPKYAVKEEVLSEVYRDLFSKLPLTSNFVILTHTSVKEEVFRWLNEANIKNKQLIHVPDHLHFSIWAEDAYVINQDTRSSKRYFLEPYEFLRYADSLIADFVNKGTDILNLKVPLYFQGGNVLIGDDFWMIGADYPANSLKYIGSVIERKPEETPQDTIKRLYKEYFDSSRKCIYVGSTIPVPSKTVREFKKSGELWKEVLYEGNKLGTVQPLFHIDMFITLLGRNSEGKYQVLVGDPRMASDILKLPVLPHSMPEVFDNIAQGLKKIGFEVLRNPLPLVYFDDQETKERRWYFATSNNALVQIAENGGKTVWLPSYGYGDWSSLSKTDKANKQIWEKLGFEVHMLGDFHPFAENLGAVHCIKKYLKRA